MKGTTILAVTKDAEWLVAMRPALTEAGRWRLIVAETMSEAAHLLGCTKPDTVVVDWADDTARVEGLEELLWKDSVQTRQIPVVIVAKQYRVDEATLLYRLGVAEYVSQADHRAALGRILAAHTPGGAGPGAWRPPATPDPDAVHCGLAADEDL